MNEQSINFFGHRTTIAFCIAILVSSIHCTMASPNDDETVSIVAKARNGIVNIEARIGLSEQMGPFGKALSNHLSRKDDTQQKWYLSLGSGVVWDDKGNIVTTKSVVKSSDQIMVRSIQGDTFHAKVIGFDDLTNITVLSLESELPASLQPITHREKKLSEGSWLLLMGYGYGGLPTISPGMAGIPPEDYDPGRHWFQFTAPIRPGNSGSALIDSDGRLAGIALGREEDIGFNAVVRMLTSQNQQGLSPSQLNSYSSLGVGIPINQVKPIVDQIIRSGRVIRGWIGVSVREIQQDKAENGLDVVRIIPGSPADNAGLELGDMIHCINGMDVRNPKDLGRMIHELTPGSRVSIDFSRDGKNLRTDVLILERPAQRDLVRDDSSARSSSEPESSSEPGPSSESGPSDTKTTTETESVDN